VAHTQQNSRIRERVQKVVFDTIDQMNQEEVENPLEKSTEVVLLGKSGKLDSLGLVRLIVATEQNLETEFGIQLTIADERALSQSVSPFKTLGTLINYIQTLVEEHLHA
jgi:acyl carrier protein